MISARRGGVLAVLLLAVAPTLFAQAPSPSSSPGKDQAVTTLTIFAGTPDGLWRSRSWGNEWERVRAPGLEGLGAVRAVYPLGPWVFVGGDGGLYNSRDFGETWERTYTASPVLCVLTSRYPMSDQTVFIGTPNGLLRSDDFGATFTPTKLTETAVLRLEWPGPDLLVATARGLKVSEDGKPEFRDVGLMQSVSALAVSSYYASDPVAFVGLANGVMRSSDRAQTWIRVGLSGQAINDLVWLGPFLYAATSVGFFRSEDAGLTWTPLGEGITGTARRLLFPLAPTSGAEAFLATSNGIFWTGDGGLHWNPSGLQKESVLVVATFPGPNTSASKSKKR